MSDTTTNVSSPSSLAFTTLLRPSFWLGGNWKKAIKESALPADIQTIIHQIVSRSRLMRRERFDVAEELIQHFQDGNRQGKSFDLLKEKFGDSEAATLLIRRSKIRNRSIWLSTARMIPLFMLGLSIPYLLLLYWYHSGESNPSVDYSAAFNETALAASEQDKAWPLYRYHREHKKWPATAAELIGPYLNEVPVDILTGQPLLFKIQDDQPVIYSVGLDRDDDGGVDAQANGKSIDRESVNPGPRDDNFEGDWILWPQNAEG